MKRDNWKPKHNVKLLISNYEEVGHGAAYIPADINEMIAVDMGRIGDDLSREGNRCIHLREGFIRSL